MRSFCCLLLVAVVLEAGCSRRTPDRASFKDVPATTTTEDRESASDGPDAAPTPAGSTAAIGGGKVLVAGESPLTEGTVERYQQMWQWYCDLRLSPDQL